MSAPDYGSASLVQGDNSGASEAAIAMDTAELPPTDEQSAAVLESLE